MALKLLVVLDYVRTEYCNKDGDLDYFNSPEGKEFYRILTAPRAGLGLKDTEYNITFAYPKIPTVDDRGKYRPVTKKEGEPFFAQLQDKIADLNPELVLCLGLTAAQGVIAKKSIDGMPTRRSFEHGDNKCNPWVVRTYPLSAVSVNKNAAPVFNTSINAIKRYLVEGDKAFVPNVGNYTIVNDFSEAQQVFAEVNKYGNDIQHPISMDFETNTKELVKAACKHQKNMNSKEVRDFYPEIDQEDYVGAKIEMFSLSVKENQGWTIPIGHAESNYTQEQKDWIISQYINLIKGPKWVVGHNFKFDLAFNKLATRPKHEPFEAVNCIDTMIMFYIGVEEDSLVSKKDLKLLAYKYTSMGGYDKPLDDYRDNYAQRAYKRWQEKNPDKKRAEYTAPINELNDGVFNYGWIPLNIIGKYAAGDTDACLRIYHALYPVINDNSKWKNLIYNFYPHLINTLTNIEAAGVKIDSDKAAILHKKYSKEYDRLFKKLRSEVPEVKQLEDYNRDCLRKYNIEMEKSPKDRDKSVIKEYSRYKGTKKDPDVNVVYSPTKTQMTQMILFVFKGYKLPPEDDYLAGKSKKKLKRDPTGATIKWYDYSLSAKTTMVWLQDKYPDDPFITLYSKLAKVKKMLNSFIDKLPQLVDEEGYSHPKFIPTGTVTGRLASSNYNIQQLPANHGENPSSILYQFPVKGMLTSRFKGGLILNADYSFLEIRVAALLAQDKNMIQAILDGVDYHTRTASLAFNVPPEKVSAYQRQGAKKVSFGLIYGESAMGLAKSIDTTKEDAQSIMNKVLRAYPKLDKVIQDTETFAKKSKYVETLFGFRRRLPEVGSADKSTASRALRQSFNARVQGSGAYFTNNALILMDSIFKKLKLKSRVVLTVHDSIGVDCSPDELYLVAKIMLTSFEQIPLPILTAHTTEGLNVPSQYMMPDGVHYRFPMAAELSIGRDYGEDLEYDEDEIKKYKSPASYCDYARRVQIIEDCFSAKMLSAEARDKALAELKATQGNYLK